MAELIPSYSITDFKKLKPEQLKRLKSCEVTSNGGHLFTFVNPATDYIRLSAEQLALMSNAVQGEDLEKILELVHATV